MFFRAIFSIPFHSKFSSAPRPCFRALSFLTPSSVFRNAWPDRQRPIPQPKSPPNRSKKIGSGDLSFLSRPGARSFARFERGIWRGGRRIWCDDEYGDDLEDETLGSLFSRLRSSISEFDYFEKFSPRSRSGSGRDKAGGRVSFQKIFVEAEEGALDEDDFMGEILRQKAQRRKIRKMNKKLENERANESLNDFLDEHDIGGSGIMRFKSQKKRSKWSDDSELSKSKKIGKKIKAFSIFRNFATENSKTVIEKRKWHTHENSSMQFEAINSKDYFTKK